VIARDTPMNQENPANVCFKCQKGQLTPIENNLWKCESCGFEIPTKRKEYIEKYCMQCPEWTYRDRNNPNWECGDLEYPCPINNYVKEN
jgi:RNA polymerase-binding transcription factor DksA